jgi:hypothetical protein
MLRFARHDKSFAQPEAEKRKPKIFKIGNLAWGYLPPILQIKDLKAKSSKERS